MKFLKKVDIGIYRHAESPNSHGLYAYTVDENGCRKNIVPVFEHGNLPWVNSQYSRKEKRENYKKFVALVESGVDEAEARVYSRLLLSKEEILQELKSNC